MNATVILHPEVEALSKKSKWSRRPSKNNEVTLIWYTAECTATFSIIKTKFYGMIQVQSST